MWTLFPNVNGCEVIVCIGRMAGSKDAMLLFYLIVGGGWECVL
jgi:hypothetical protein